jgi:nucleotide-binding universal stress UspA family protein
MQADCPERGVIMTAIHKILCPVDFSACSDHALKYALAFAQSHQAALELLHVVEPLIYGVGSGGIGGALQTTYLEDVGKGASEHLAGVVGELRRRYDQVTGLTVDGTPFVEIIRRARDQKTDLIVMGTHGRRGLPHLLIGSVAERVVRKAPCPVLTVKHPEHDFVMP